MIKSTSTFAMAVAMATALVLVSGCGKRRASGEALSQEGRALSEVAVQPREIATAAKTAGGHPVRLYELTVKDQKHAVVVVGDTTVPVVFPNARFVEVGGKKAELDLSSAPAGSYMVPVANPTIGYRHLSQPPASLLGMAKAEKIDLPVADEVVASLSKK